MLELCAERGVTVLAFGTIAGGFLTERWFSKTEPDWDALETWSQMKYGRFIREAGGWAALQDLLAVVHRVAARTLKSMRRFRNCTRFRVIAATNTGGRLI